MSAEVNLEASGQMFFFLELTRLYWTRLNNSAFLSVKWIVRVKYCFLKVLNDLCMFMCVHVMWCRMEFYGVVQCLKRMKFTNLGYRVSSGLSLQTGDSQNIYAHQDWVD